MKGFKLDSAMAAGLGTLVLGIVEAIWGGYTAYTSAKEQNSNVEDIVNECIKKYMEEHKNGY